MPPLPRIYGLDPPERKIPKQDWHTVHLHAERFNRAAAAQSTWSKEAKKAVEYVEGKQWSAQDLAKLDAEGRPALTINKLRPLVELVRGYHLNNRTEVAFLPGHDGTGTAPVAEALTQVSKQIDEISEGPYVDMEVFLDGITSGRGYYDGRLHFEDNIYGDLKWRAQDPFATYPDPDGDQYDLNESNYVMTSRYVSLDEVEAVYGVDAAALIRPWFEGNAFSGLPSSSHLLDYFEEVSPWRRFGGDQDEMTAGTWASYETWYDWVDTARKSIRLIDIQHNVPMRMNYFVSLETGDREEIPRDWNKARIQKVIDWSYQNNDPVAVVNLPGRKVRWTHMVGDIIVFDDWSPYRSFSIVPFFPYFRRGQTRGMVHDLIGPQDEINKRRSSRLNIIGRTANGGWMYAKGSLNPIQKAKLRKYGSTPGVEIEYDTRGGKLDKPSQIEPSTSPIAIQQLEADSDNDLYDISGINKDAMGQIDKVQSGRAIEAKQRQTIVGLESFMANYHRTKGLCGLKTLEVVQGHYTEQRVVRVMGNHGQPEQTVINEMTASGVINNVNLGKYAIIVDDTPLSASFLNAQFEELLRLKELGMPIPDDWLIDAMSIGRKDALREAMRQMREQEAAEKQAEMAAMAAQAGGPPPGGGGPAGPGGVPATGAPPVGAEGDAIGPAGSEPGRPRLVAV